MTTVSRDTFARTELVRHMVRLLPRPGTTCSWCGGLNHYGKLFEYGTERDDKPGESNVNWHKGLFCSKGCHDAYHS